MSPHIFCVAVPGTQNSHTPAEAVAEFGPMCVRGAVGEPGAAGSRQGRPPPAPTACLLRQAVSSAAESRASLQALRPQSWGMSQSLSYFPFSRACHAEVFKPFPRNVSPLALPPALSPEGTLFSRSS